MNYVISSASVLLPKSSCQLQWGPKLLKTFHCYLLFIFIEEDVIYRCLTRVNHIIPIKLV
jgi:hypothetical protein